MRTLSDPATTTGAASQTSVQVTAEPTVPSEWLSAKGLRKMLGGDISLSTILGWRSTGIGPPYVRLGGLIRYRPADVEKWIAADGDRRGAAKQQ